MTISQRIFYLLKKQGKKQNQLSEFTGISTSTISAWNKRGTNPAAESIPIIADFFNVSTHYLLTGEECSNNTSISNSNIVDHSNGTITIHNNSAPTETKAENSEHHIPKQEINETSKELLEVFESLPMRERVKLLNIVYDYEEQYRKSHI